MIENLEIDEQFEMIEGQEVCHILVITGKI